MLYPSGSTTHKIFGECGDWDVFWPFPKVYFLSHYTLAIAYQVSHPCGYFPSELGLFELFCDDDNYWYATLVYLLGPNANIDHIEVADFGPFYMISASDRNGTNIYSYYRNPGATVDMISAYPTIQVPVFKACCNFNGQALIGGIKCGGDASFADLSMNSIAWSGIGRIEFRVHQDKTAGYLKAPIGEWDTGIIHKLLPLGNGVMAYADGGACYLTPFTSGNATGYTPKPIPGLTLYHAGMVCGDRNNHLIIGHDGHIRLIDANLQITDLDYRSVTDNLTVEDIRVSHDPVENYFYISDGVHGYILTTNGLYESHQCPTSVGRYRGRLAGFFVDTADYEARFKLSPLDFRQRSLKSVSTFEIGGIYSSASNVFKIATEFRSNANCASSAFSSLDWVTTNPDGVGYQLVTGTEFRPKVKCADYRNGEITMDRITLRYKMTDKRYIRGTYYADNTNK